MHILIHPTYSPSIAHFVAIAKATSITFEVCDNYQKQTYRNRSYVYGANGKLLLNIPVIYTQKNRQLYRDVQIANPEKWQDIHWKSLQSAYQMSPFFEYYDYELQPLFHKEFSSILDFNLELFSVICNCLEIKTPIYKTTEYLKEPENLRDYRHLVNAKKEPHFNFTPYTQVFTQKHGFLPNLSILDLLFNEGPNTLNYLEQQTLNCNA